MVHKRHMNQTKSRHTDEPMEVCFNTFDVLILQKAPEAKILKIRGKEEI